MIKVSYFQYGQWNDIPDIFDYRYDYNLCPTKSFTFGSAISAQFLFDTKQEIDKDLRVRFSVKYSNDARWRHLGIFNIINITKNGDFYHYECYDDIIWLQQSGNMIVAEYDAEPLYSIVSHVEFNYADYGGDITFINSTVTYPVNTGFRYDNLRQVAADIAFMGCGYALMMPIENENETAYYHIKRFTPTGKVLGKGNYYNCDLREAKTIAGLKINDYYAGSSPRYDKSSKNDVFYKQYSDDKQTALDNIMNAIPQNYYSGTVCMYEDNGVNVTDDITVDGKRFIVMHKVIDKRGCVLEGYNFQQYITPLEQRIALCEQDIANISIPAWAQKPNIETDDTTILNNFSFTNEYGTTFDNPQLYMLLKYILRRLPAAPEEMETYIVLAPIALDKQPHVIQDYIKGTLFSGNLYDYNATSQQGKFVISQSGLSATYITAQSTVIGKDTDASLIYDTIMMTPKNVTDKFRYLVVLLGANTMKVGDTTQYMGSPNSKKVTKIEKYNYGLAGDSAVYQTIDEVSQSTVADITYTSEEITVPGHSSVKKSYTNIMFKERGIYKFTVSYKVGFITDTTYVYYVVN